jgi:uncharacterized protein YbdZ (MbtH family)
MLRGMAYVEAAMNTIDDADYAIVKCEMQYNIWPTAQALPPGYSFTGPVGTRAEMEALLSDQFVETTAASYCQTGNFIDTVWVPQ